MDLTNASTEELQAELERRETPVPSAAERRIEAKFLTKFLRDDGFITPWELLSQGWGTKTFTRSMKGYEDDALMVVRGKPYAVAWAISSAKAENTQGHMVFCAGVVRGYPAEAVYQVAQNLADAALAQIDPEKPETYNLDPNLTEDDLAVLRQNDLM